LTRIGEFIKTINKNELTNGIFIFAGISDIGEEIFEYIIPENKIELFIYNCSSKFDTSLIAKYMTKYSGSIIFANGSDCYIYEWNGGKFNKIKHINANLIKRHNKGGQSSVRFARLAEESRLHYVTHIIDYLNQIQTKNNWIFGSDEIVKMIMERKNEIYVQLTNGGFYNFNNTTITNTEYWLSYIEQKNNYDKYYEKILNYLDTDIDRLDFDRNNKDQMEFYIDLDEPVNTNTLNLSLVDKLHLKQIPLTIDSKYYSRLQIFTYIGVKYFAYDIAEDNEKIN
jgi:hypothetical protein